MAVARQYNFKDGGNPTASMETVDISAADHTPTNPVRAIYIGTAGALKIDTADGETITIANAIVGYHPIRIALVWRTGTTAADMHLLF